MSTPLVSDEQIYKRVDEYTLPYRTEITRVTKEFRDIYEAELQSMRERLSRMEAALRRAQESMYYAKEKGIGIGGTGYIDEALSNK